MLNLSPTLYEAIIATLLAFGLVRAISTSRAASSFRAKIVTLSDERSSLQDGRATLRDEITKLKGVIEKVTATATKAIMNITVLGAEVVRKAEARTAAVEKSARDTIAELDDEIDELQEEIENLKALAAVNAKNTGEEESGIGDIARRFGAGSPIDNLLRGSPTGRIPADVPTYAFRVGQGGRLTPTDARSKSLLDLLGHDFLTRGSVVVGGDFTTTNTMPGADARPLTAQSLRDALRDLPFRDLPIGRRDLHYGEIERRILGDVEAAADFATDPPEREGKNSNAGAGTGNPYEDFATDTPEPHSGPYMGKNGAGTRPVGKKAELAAGYGSDAGSKGTHEASAAPKFGVGGDRAAADGSAGPKDARQAPHMHCAGPYVPEEKFTGPNDLGAG